MLRRRREIWKYETTILKIISHVICQVVENEATTLSPNDIDDEEDESGRDADDGDDSDEEDAEDAFNDIEDEDLLCANYEAAPQKKMLPHAVVIGVRKGGTR